MIAELLNVDLVKELGLDALPAEKRAALVNQMSGVLDNRINSEALSMLSEEDKKELDKVLDSNGDMVGFLRSKISNFDLMVAETVANFKKEMLDMQQSLLVAK